MTIPSRHSHLLSDQLMETFKNRQFQSPGTQNGFKSVSRSHIMFTQDQVTQLEILFSNDPYPKMKDRREIADVMRISERRVQVKLLFLLKSQLAKTTYI